MGNNKNKFIYIIKLCIQAQAGECELHLKRSSCWRQRGKICCEAKRHGGVPRRFVSADSGSFIIHHGVQGWSRTLLRKSHLSCIWHFCSVKMTVKKLSKLHVYFVYDKSHATSTLSPLDFTIWYQCNLCAVTRIIAFLDRPGLDGPSPPDRPGPICKVWATALCIHRAKWVTTNGSALVES